MGQDGGAGARWLGARGLDRYPAADLGEVAIDNSELSADAFAGDFRAATG